MGEPIQRPPELRRGRAGGGKARCASLLACTLLAAAGSGCRSRPALTAQQAEGQHLYESRCAHCHEYNDLGLKPPPPSVRGAMQKPKLPDGAPATDAEVRRQVIYGKGNMPSFSGRFTEEQMAALLSYLHTDMPPSEDR